MVRPSLSKRLLNDCSGRPGPLLCLLFCLFAWTAPSLADDPRLLATFELHTASEFHDALTRAERLLEAGEVRLNTDYPVAFVLHGPEVHVLERANYAQHKDLVDLAARLSALGVVEIKACERWMGGNGVNPASLHAFVGTVPWGTAEEQRLRQQSYISF